MIGNHVLQGHARELFTMCYIKKKDIKLYTQCNYNYVKTDLYLSIHRHCSPLSKKPENTVTVIFIVWELPVMFFLLYTFLFFEFSP